MSSQLTKEEVKIIQDALRYKIDSVMKNKVSSANIQKVAGMIELILKIERR